MTTDPLAPFKLARWREHFADIAQAAAVTPRSTLPIAPVGTPWDGPEAKRRILDYYRNDDDTVDVDGVERAFLYRDTDLDPAVQAAWKLGIADIVDGEPQIIPIGVRSSAGGHGVDAADIPENEKAAIRTRITQLYDRIRRDVDDTWPESPFTRED